MNSIKPNRLDSQIARFLSVARCGNIHAAARQLNMTQSALTRSIQKMETQLGVALFERSVLGTSLTTFGSVFLKYATSVEAELRNAQAELNEIRTGQLGQLRVAAGAVWLSLILPRVVTALQRHPTRPLVSCTQYRGDDAFERLIANDYDVICGLVEERFSVPGIVVRNKIQIDMCLVVGNHHPLVGKTGANALRKAVGFPFVLLALNAHMNSVLNRTLDERGLPFPRVAMETTSILAVFNILRESDFVGFVAAPLARHARLPGLAIIPLEPVFRYDTAIIHRRSLSSLGVYRAFIAELDVSLRQLGLSPKPDDGPRKRGAAPR